MPKKSFKKRDYRFDPETHRFLRDLALYTIRNDIPEEWAWHIMRSHIYHLHDLGLFGSPSEAQETRYKSILEYYIARERHYRNRR